MSLCMAVGRLLPMARASAATRLASPTRRALSDKRAMPVGDTANAVAAAEVVGLPSNSNAGAKIAGGLLVATTAGLWGWSTLRAPGSGMWTIRGKTV